MLLNAWTLWHCRVRFSDKRSLNDPFEFQYDVDDAALAARYLGSRHEALDRAISQTSDAKGLRDYLVDHPKAPKWNRKKRRWLTRGRRSPVEKFKDRLLTEDPLAAANKFLRHLDKNAAELVVFCCSANADCVPMWAHYAREHSGFQIGFCPLALFSNNTHAKDIPLWQIDYVDIPPTIEFADADSTPAYAFAASKKLEWSYESEWRYIAHRSWADSRAGDIDLFNFSPAAIKEITFGSRASPNLRRALISAARAAGLTCSFWEVQPAARSFKFQKTACGTQA